MPLLLVAMPLLLLARTLLASRPGRLCELGTIAQADGATRCEPCGLGEYANSSGMSSCYRRLALGGAGGHSAEATNGSKGGVGVMIGGDVINGFVGTLREYSVMLHKMWISAALHIDGPSFPV